MPNPGGDYPGRQIFLGTTKEGRPAFVYLVSGRSAPSQQRYALSVPSENSIRIKPLDPNEKFDPFRHYQAVRMDQETGLLTVSNNQATQDPVFEAYSFRDRMSRGLPIGRMGRILDAIGPEYDSEEKPTPRIMGVVTPWTGGVHTFDLGITTEPGSVHLKQMPMDSKDGTFLGVQTYDGNFDYKSFDPKDFIDGRVRAEFDSVYAQDLAEELFDMSDYTHPEKGELRVCTVAGVMYGNDWTLAAKNRQVPR